MISFKRKRESLSLHTYGCTCEADSCWSCSTTCAATNCDCSWDPQIITADIAYSIENDTGFSEVSANNKDTTSAMRYNDK